PPPRQLPAPARRQPLLHPLRTGYRAPHLDRVQYPTGIVHVAVLLPPAGDHALGLHVPGGEHARRPAILDAARSHPPLPGGGARYILSGGGLGVSVISSLDPRVNGYRMCTVLNS